MNIVNLTPHTLNLIGQDGQEMVVLKSGTECRLVEDRVMAGERGGLSVTIPNWGEIKDLPAPEADTIYVVSALVLAQIPILCPARAADVFAPGVAKRDDQGRQVGAVGLSAAPNYQVAIS